MTMTCVPGSGDGSSKNQAASVGELRRGTRIKTQPVPLYDEAPSRRGGRYLKD